MFYKDKRIAVICNDKKYEHEVKYLADLATEVLYFPAYNDSEIELPNVKISKDVPIALIGDSFVEGITLRSGKTESVDGVFCLRNAIAPSKLMPQLEIETDIYWWIEPSRQMWQAVLRQETAQAGHTSTRRLSEKEMWQHIRVYIS